MNRHVVRALASVLFLISTTIAVSEVKPSNLQVAKEGDTTYFRIELAMPADALGTADMTVFWQTGRFPRLPILLGDSPHDPAIFLLTRRSNEWSPAEPTGGFFGKTRRGGPLSLRLIYPKNKGGWGEETVQVDFQKATPLGGGDPTNPGSTSKLKPVEQFGKAQSAWLDLMGRQLGDPTGFYAYGMVQSLRMADLPASAVDRTAWRNVDDRSPERLYETATGARAIQESLQLDRMLGLDRTTEPRTIDVKTLAGVQTKSHPFEQMMGGREPKFSAVAALIPGDQYMLRFTSLAKFQEFADFTQQWGQSLLQSVDVGEPDSGLRERYHKQLCLPSTLLSRLLGPAVVREIAVTGSDPYLREGTDLTVIFDLVAPELFKAAVDRYWKDATAAGAKPQSSTEGEVSIESLVTPDRSVSAYRVFADKIAIYSNSPVALKRVLAMKRDTSSSLAAQPDFKYMRVVWPQDEQAEDGFLYLSDAFIRRVVGPENKIGEKRRLEALGALRLLSNAAMFHRFVQGPGPIPSMDEMKKAGTLHARDLRTSDAGELAWDPETATASSSVYGTQKFLTPLCEIPVDKVGESERRGYEQFRDRYQIYWRRYFDPIGIRIKVGPTITVEAHILPLIDESHYNELKRWTGAEAGKLNLAQISTGTLARWQVRLDPEKGPLRDTRRSLGSMFGRDSAITDWIGNWFAVWLEDGTGTEPAIREVLREEFGDDDEVAQRHRGRIDTFLRIPVAAGVHVRNPLSLAGFLIALNGMASTAAPGLVTFLPQEPYKGTTLVKIAPRMDGELGKELLNDLATTAPDGTTTVPDLGIYYGTIGSGWYVSTQEYILRRLVDQLAVPSASVETREIQYSAYLQVSPGNARKAKPAIEAAIEGISRVSERRQLMEAWLLYRCGLAQAGDDITSVSAAFLGGPVVLPSGGKISYDPKSDQAVSSVYGGMRELKKLDQPNPDNRLARVVRQILHLRAWLTFLEDGLETHVELERAARP